MTYKHMQHHQAAGSPARRCAMTICMCLPAMLITLLTTGQTSANILKFTGKAVSESGELQYLEQHVVRYEDGKLSESKTVYLDQNNRRIGDLTSDYEQGSQFGSYVFHDLRAAYKDGAKVKDDRILVFRRSDPQSPIDEKELQRSENQIVGQGFNHFISENLDAIVNGRIMHVSLVLPSRLNQYSFRVRLLKAESDIASIRLEIDNWFLRLFAPHVDAEYNLTTGRLVRYEGISNLTDASGKHKKVIIIYEYESTKDT